MSLLTNIINDNKFTPEDIPDFEQKLFFEGAQRRVNLERFTILLFLATVIATYGVLGDSVATIIGAMIIAPLMRPIMATAAGLVMGNMRRAAVSFLTVVLGVIGVIFTSWFLSTFLNTTVISFTHNASIISRISPSLTDLMIALASGAAGAFAMSRADVSDTLPGVAISISLVPPLCVVGIGLSKMEWDVAQGAMLLFLTNFLSILLAGGGIFATLGLARATTRKLIGPNRRRAYTVIMIGLILVAIPLSITSYRVARESIIELQTQEYVLKWLADTDYEISKVDADRNVIEVVINGMGDLPPLGNLGEELKREIDNGTIVSLRIISATVHSYPDVGEQAAAE